MNEKTLVTGASGNLGKLIVKNLLARGCRNLVAIARNPASVFELAALGVEVRAADYLQPKTLDYAFSDITRLLLVSSSSVATRAEEHHNVIAAAREQDVAHIVYTSVLHADRWETRLMQDHINTEASIRSSGMDWTFLRNGWYWENHTPRIAPAIASGNLIGCSGPARISWASRRDYAEAAAAVLTSGEHRGKTYELAGDTPYTLEYLAQEVSRQSGKTIVFRNMSEQEFASILSTVGVPPQLATVFAALEAKGVVTGILEDNSNMLSRLIGRPTTSISQAVADILAF